MVVAVISLMTSSFSGGAWTFGKALPRNMARKLSDCERRAIVAAEWQSLEKV